MKITKTILLAGGVEFRDYYWMQRTLNTMRQGRDIRLVCGTEATGLDAFARSYARASKTKFKALLVAQIAVLMMLTPPALDAVLLFPGAPEEIENRARKHGLRVIKAPHIPAPTTSIYDTTIKA